MLGGPLEPCLPSQYLPLRALEDEDGRVTRRARQCPRVVLSSSNEALIPLILTTIDETTRVLAPYVLEATLGPPGATLRNRGSVRVARALRSDRVRTAMRARARQSAPAAESAGAMEAKRDGLSAEADGPEV